MHHAGRFAAPTAVMFSLREGGLSPEINKARYVSGIVVALAALFIVTLVSAPPPGAAAVMAPAAGSAPQPRTR